MSPENHPAIPGQKLGSIALGASATLISSVSSIGIGVVINILIARALGPELKGGIDLILASSGLTVIIVGMSLTSGITYVVAHGQVDHRALFWQLMGISLLQGLSVWLILTIILRTRFAYAFIPPGYISWGAVGISLLAFANLLGGYGRAFLSGLQRFVTTAVLDLLGRIFMAGATITVLIWFGRSVGQAATAIIFGSILANYSVAALTFVFIWPYLDYQYASSRFRQVWQYSLPSYAGNLVQFANYRLDVFLVAYFVGVRDVALYGVAVSIAQLLWLPSNAMQSVLFPRLSAMSEAHQKAEDAARIMRLMLLLTLIMAMVLAIIAPWLVTFLFGESFAPSLMPLWFLLPGIVMFCIANILCGYLAAIGKPQLNFLSALGGLSVTLTLDLILIPKTGIVGAAIASSVSYSISAVLALYFFMRESGQTFVHSVLLNMTDIKLTLEILKQYQHKIYSRLGWKKNAS